MQAFPAYYEKGLIIPVGNPEIPEGRRIIITVLDEPAPENRVTRQLAALERFREGIRASNTDEPLGTEFDEILSQRPVFAREVDL